MRPEGNILVNSSISTFQQGLTHSALVATVGHLSIMLQQVRFEFFSHLEEEIALNT